MKKTTKFLMAALPVALAAQASAQTTAVTDPVGYITAQAFGNRLSLIGAPLAEAVLFQGAITAIDDASISVDGTPFTADQFNGAGNPHLVEIISGTGAGAWTNITSTAAGSIGSEDDMTVFAAVGDDIIIRRHNTIGSVFGEANEAGLTPGDQAANADQIVFFDAASGQSSVIFFSNLAAPFDGWRDPAFNDATNVAIEPQQGIQILRSAAAQQDITVVGHVRTTPLQVSIFNDLNTVAINAPVGISLNDSGLFTGDAATGVQAGDQAANADEVIVFEDDGSQAVYFYSNLAAPFDGWRDSAFNDVGDVVLGEGDSVIVLRKGGGDFAWTVPAPTIGN